MRFQRLIPFASSVLLAVTVGCGESDAPSPTSGSSPDSTPAAAPASPPAAPDPADLVAEGRSVYLGNCIACHNPDPKADGALGPPIAGASEPLLEARVLRGEYPDGYTPKRTTGNMIPMPFLEKKIPALAAYLASEG